MSGAKALVFLAEAESSLMFANDLSSGNVQVSLPYIPGTALRGALAYQYGVPESDASQYMDFLNLFCRNKIRFTNLYPAPEGVRCLPIPLSARTKKINPGFRNEIEPGMPACEGVKDFLLHGIGIAEDEVGIEEISGFYLPGTYIRRFPNYELVTQNRIDPATGTTKEGSLYTRRKLASCNLFMGYIIFSDDPDGSLLQDFCNGLGVSSGDSFVISVGQKRGRLRLSNLGVDDFPPPYDVQNRMDSLSIIGKSSILLSLTLQSDTILLDDFLRYLSWIPASFLQETLIRADAPKEIILEEKRSFTRLCPIFGWNTAHGLPRETDWAIEKGSSFLYELRKSSGGTFSEDDVKALTKAIEKTEASGLGLRCGEGFGEAIFSDRFHQLDEFQGEKI